MERSFFFLRTILTTLVPLHFREKLYNQRIDVCTKLPVGLGSGLWHNLQTSWGE